MANTMKRLLSFVFSIFCFIYLSAQEDQAPVPTLESPFNTMFVHLYYLQPDSYQPDIAAVTVSRVETDSSERVKAAIQLKQILDGEGLYVRLN
jgi:MscS family membrane protein